jgi:hypothetical protein
MSNSLEYTQGYNAGIYQSAHVLQTLAQDIRDLKGPHSKDAKFLEDISNMLTNDFIEMEKK